ncbi:MAG: epoxyqueuosine reductase [Verrucomicrobiota bacterium]|nr:epoxyqueuosine reductase [Verrucomicrobiota bacterium]
MTTQACPAVTGVRREKLREQLQALGFDAVRFATATRPAGESLRQWIEAGHHADMAWIERTVDKRQNPDLVLPGARSVILLGVNYWSGPEIGNRKSKSENLAWARYVLHTDYHDTIKAGLAEAGRLLEREHGAAATDYRYYVDTGPVLERGWAARSGLGFIGKNAILISRDYGNWLFLACILTRLEIEADEPLRPESVRANGHEPAGLLCGKCTRCLDACPTQAFPQPGVVDARRCISYQTIENKGVIPRELRQGIGTRIYGCDVCLEVCPWNRFAQEGRRVLLTVRGEIADLPLLEILELTPVRFAAVFKGTAVKRLKLSGLLRNACVVAGNSGDRTLLPVLVRLAQHELPLVRAHAVWAVRQIAGAEADTLLAAARSAETDATVRAEHPCSDGL